MSDSPFGQVKKAKPEIDFPGDTPPSELVVEDIEVGTGDEAKSGQSVEVHYAGNAWSTRHACCSPRPSRSACFAASCCGSSTSSSTPAELRFSSTIRS